MLRGIKPYSKSSISDVCVSLYAIHCTAELMAANELWSIYLHFAQIKKIQNVKQPQSHMIWHCWRNYTLQKPT